MGDGVESISKCFEWEIDFTWHYASSVLKSARNVNGWKTESQK